jgi:polar amino acid transport system substrate-binding protein
VCALTVVPAAVRCVLPRSDALADARRAGVIRIGYAVEAPYAFITPEGKVTGESPEIARVVAARLGIPRVIWRLAEFGDLIEGLEARRFDVIAAGMFITPKRQERVAFSLPTFQAGAGLLVRKGNPLALHAYADLLRSGARVAVLTGSAEEARLLELGCPEARLVRVPDAASGRAAVRAGQAEALVLSAPTIRWMAQHPVAGLTEMAEPFDDAAAGVAGTKAQGGFVFRRSEAALCQAWNAELARFLGSEAHRRLVGAFGFTEAELLPSAAKPPTAPKP